MPRFVAVEELFKGRHFDQEIVVLCVRWYLSFKLSYRDLVSYDERTGRRHRAHDHSEVGATLHTGFREALETIRSHCRWIDFHLGRKRDVNAAKAFLRKAMKAQRISTKMTLDAYAASQRAVAELKDNGEVPQRVPVRTSEYLNNLIEQDHRRVKQRLRPMLGLKSFRTAAVVISGIELAEKIKKKQFQISKLGALWVGE